MADCGELNAQAPELSETFVRLRDRTMLACPPNGGGVTNVPGLLLVPFLPLVFEHGRGS